MAEPSAWPTEITEPFRARATGAPPVMSISRAWITGVIENSAVAATKMPRPTSAALGQPVGAT